ncbi:murein hydrolase activator EnvC, partial [Ferrovibrio sp.]
APPGSAPSGSAPSSTPSPAAEPAAPQQEAVLPPRSGRTFSWPVRGRVLSTFGPKPDGLHNDGINIAARAGAPVIAAENGVVVYAGSELKGFGNLLLVRHADGWMTAYAHLDKALVKKGQKVTRGQAIGTVGSTGGVSQPQLHFEIRKGTQAVDPAKFLSVA